MVVEVEVAAVVAEVAVAVGEVVAALGPHRWESTVTTSPSSDHATFLGEQSKSSKVGEKSSAPQ